LFRRLPSAGWLRPLVATLLVGTVLLNFVPASLRPDSCCAYFNQDDRQAFRWIRENTNAQALILISAYTAGRAVVGTDAGLWITPLTGRPAAEMPYNIDWSSPAAFEQACRFGAQETYVYAGGKASSFLMGKPSYGVGIRLAFQSGKTSVYQLVGCQHE
jgi:hypothetical protein